MMRNDTVIGLFAKGTTDKHSENVRSVGDVLYSYRLPIAVRRKAKDNLQSRESWILLNGDRSTITTNGHIRETFSAMPNEPRVSFSALQAARLGIEQVKLVDVWPDASVSVRKAEDPDRFATFEQEVPAGAIMQHTEKDTQWEMKSYHRIGSVLLRDGENDYLASMDEGSYFLSQMPWRCNTIAEAFTSLKPARVQTAEENGWTVPRQGEWFFLPLGSFAEMRKKLGLKKSHAKRFALPRRTTQQNRHMVNGWVIPAVSTKTQAHESLIEPAFVCWGLVRHWDRWRDRWTREHSPRDLGKEQVFLAIRNLSVNDWSAQGGVD